MNYLRRIVGVGCIAAWVSLFMSLWFPAYYGSNGQYLPGWVCFFFGWMGFDEHYSWFANPALLTCHLLMVRGYHRTALFCGAVAVPLAMTSFRESEFPNLVRESKIIGYGAGFYLWHVSVVLSFLISAAECCVSLRKPDSPAADAGEISP